MNTVLPPKLQSFLKHKPWIRQDRRTTKTIRTNNPWRNHIKVLGFLSFLFTLFLLSSSLFQNPSSKSIINNTLFKNHTIVNRCLNRYIYIQNLPPRFNQDVLKDCKSITRHKDVTSMCTNLVNNGFGPLIKDPDGFLTGSWFSTNQFTLEVIFHERMKKYDCLTNDSLIASGVYVPYYAGLDLRRYLWRPDTSLRDSSSVALLDFLSKKQEWKGKIGFL